MSAPRDLLRPVALTAEWLDAMGLRAATCEAGVLRLRFDNRTETWGALTGAPPPEAEILHLGGRSYRFLRSRYEEDDA